MEQNISLSDDFLMEDDEDELIYTSMKELCFPNSYRHLHVEGGDSVKHGESCRQENRNLKTLNSNTSKASQADVIGEYKLKVQGTLDNNTNKLNRSVTRGVNLVSNVLTGEYDANSISYNFKRHFAGKGRGRLRMKDN